MKLTSSLPQISPPPQISLPPQTSLSPTSSLHQISLPPTPFSSPSSQFPPPLLGDYSHLQSLPSLAEEKPSLNHLPFSQSSSHLLLRPFNFPLAPLQPPCSSGQTQRVSCFRGSWKSRKKQNLSWFGNRKQEIAIFEGLQPGSKELHS